MKGSLLALALLFAAAAIAALLGLLGLRTHRPNPPGIDPSRAPGSAALPAPPAPPRLRAYSTPATLVEDLRDALGAGRPEELQSILWSVSRSLASRARWSLQKLAPRETSPKVRSLIVLAAGVHLPDSDALGALLRTDRSAEVRRAAALASGYLAAGRSRAAGPGGIPVPLGRAPARRTRAMLRGRLVVEKDPGVLEAIRTVLRAGGLSPGR